MKQILSLLLAFVFVQTQCWALSGGPFDNDQPQSANADGTYSAVLSGKNLIGMMQFGVASASETNGRFVVFVEGVLSYGVASGIADVTSKTVAGAIMGVAALTGETVGSSGNSAAPGQTITIRAAAEGMFSAKMHGFPQQVIIEGKGSLSSLANVQTTISVDDVVNGGTTTVTGDKVTRTVTNFRVRGSRTSRTGYSVFNSYAAIPPLVPNNDEEVPIVIPPIIP